MTVIFTYLLLFDIQKPFISGDVVPFHFWQLLWLQVNAINGSPHFESTVLTFTYSQPNSKISMKALLPKRVTQEWPFVNIPSVNSLTQNFRSRKSHTALTEGLDPVASRQFTLFEVSSVSSCIPWFTMATLLHRIPVKVDPEERTHWRNNGMAKKLYICIWASFILAFYLLHG